MKLFTKKHHHRRKRAMQKDHKRRMRRDAYLHSILRDTRPNEILRGIDGID